MEEGFNRQWLAAIASVLALWTFLPLALWFATFGAIAGAVIGIVGAESTGLAHSLHIGEGLGLGAAFAGLFLGAVWGFIGSYVLLFPNPIAFAVAFLSGVVIAFITLAILDQFEEQLLRLRGYREPSRRELQLLDPIMETVLTRMSIAGARPALLVSESRKPGAWTHARSVVVTQGLLGDYDDTEAAPRPDIGRPALEAVLAHELSHWERADGLSLRAVWSCFWPIVALYNLAYILRGQRGWLGILGWLILWPAWVTVKLVVAPLMAKATRQWEYEADARAAALGDDYRIGLRKALAELKEWEPPRTGWEDVLTATHPQIELRLERLEAPPMESTDRMEVFLGSPDDEPRIALGDEKARVAAERVQNALDRGNERQIAAARLGLDRAILSRLEAVRDGREHGEPDELAIASDELGKWIAKYESTVAEREKEAAPRKPARKRPKAKRSAVRPLSEEEKSEPSPASRPSSPDSEAAAEASDPDDRWPIGSG